MKLSERLYYYRFLNVSPFPGMMTGNTCAIRGDDGRLCVVDPGPAHGPRMAQIRIGLAVDGLRMSNMTSIAITHAHPDHSWIAPELARKTGATIYAHELERATLENPDGLWRAEKEALGGFRLPVLPAHVNVIEAVCRLYFGDAVPVKDWTPVGDGDYIDAGTPVRVVGLGGHRPGEIAFYIEEDAALITGDLMHRGRFNIPSLNFPVSDLGLAMDSLRRIEKLDVDIMVNGHEGPTTGRRAIKRWIRDSIARCEKMKEICAVSIARNPNIGTFDLGKRIIEWNPLFPKSEICAVAFATLKSFEEGREWIKLKSK